MTDDDKVRGCVDQWEPGSQTPPPWLSGVLLAFVVGLVSLAVWCWRLVAG